MFSLPVRFAKSSDPDPENFKFSDPNPARTRAGPGPGKTRRALPVVTIVLLFVNMIKSERNNIIRNISIDFSYSYC